MFELGSSLRAARIRRGVELAQVAAETRIRTRYLRALEEERFEMLPGAVYTTGFLRAYADYLDLDSQVFLDEYNARFRTDEPLPAPAQLELRPRSLRPYGVVGRHRPPPGAWRRAACLAAGRLLTATHALARGLGRSGRSL